MPHHKSAQRFALAFGAYLRGFETSSISVMTVTFKETPRLELTYEDLKLWLA